MTLENNALTGSIPFLNGLRRVRLLNFGSNFLTSTIPTGDEALADNETMMLLADLREITLSDNLLTGPIPTQLGLAPRLGKFLFPPIRNYVVGYILTLPIMLLDVQGEIRLEGNRLSGFIPSELGTLNRLTYLGLENNRLQGFPSTLGQLTNLEKLLLSGNPLNTTIPTEMGKMVQLSKHSILVFRTAASIETKS